MTNKRTTREVKFCSTRYTQKGLVLTGSNSLIGHLMKSKCVRRNRWNNISYFLRGHKLKRIFRLVCLLYRAIYKIFILFLAKMGMVYNAPVCHKTVLHVVNSDSCNPQFKSCKINIYNKSSGWNKSWNLWKLVLPKLKTVIVTNLADYLEESSEKMEPLGRITNANCVHVW